VPAFRKGLADVLLIHGSDESLALLYQGVAAPMRAWAANEHVFVGPASDPAGIASARDGTEAIARLASTHSPFVDFRDTGSQAIVRRLMQRAAVAPSPDWFVLDQSPVPQQVVQFAAERHAYLVVGHIPVAFGKMKAVGMKVLLSGDVMMRRPYVVLEPGPRHPASESARLRAKRLADYLVSEGGQADLEAADREAEGPWIFPLPAVDVGAR
jgi:tungstate transport system substrate-binding protein